MKQHSVVHSEIQKETNGFCYHNKALSLFFWEEFSIANTDIVVADINSLERGGEKKWNIENEN